MKIAIISDTHGPIPEDVMDYLMDRDQVWHAGDIGTMEAIDQLPASSSKYWVWGNIDDQMIRRATSEYVYFEVEGVRVLILHIGGYPGRYSQKARSLIEKHRPDVFISGHSHILKIMRDHRYNLIHFNPGACGFKGFHKVRTFIMLDIFNGEISNVQAIELARRRAISK